ncbi:DUF3365 domain-containing protein [Algoriphagus sp. H41]|uniref:DUF3365 domain-containing protein n=1 Tax=Algoriphagus oliviformis TaxID=2811231 RepID=A0ABS3BYX4_9BACT|nr:DUF3365 domain-containing protein [Algoriphagus oliviformis]MBN7810064.1 DUF3365 domain-containing protein [Algoriphagus oliviformis]
MKNTTLSIALLTLLACGPRERVSKETLDQVNESMEIKRLTEAEILEEAMVWGDSLTAEAQSQLLASLQQAIAEGGTVGALEFCNVQALPLLAAVGEAHQVGIRRVSNRSRNPLDRPDDDEAPLLEAYEYNAETGGKSDPNIQKLENGTVFLYTKPIVIPGNFCLSCHGEPGTEIDAPTLEKLAELYPEDKAKNHKVGDLRGMWSLRIPKKEVVKRL